MNKEKGSSRKMLRAARESQMINETERQVDLPTSTRPQCQELNMKLVSSFLACQEDPSSLT